MNENAMTTTFECVDIEPGDRISRGPEGDLVVFRQRDGIDYEIHLRWKNLQDYAAWCLRHIEAKDMPDSMIRELAVILCGG